MGLHMYAFKTKFQPNKEVDFSIPTEDDVDEIHRWRKHPNLHGWMEHLYVEKGGKTKFNGVNLQLHPEDLNHLKKDIINKQLPENGGFFFGKSFKDEAEIKDDLTFIEKAEEAINHGYTVFYTSKW